MAGPDPALETLFLPFDSGQLAWPQEGRALFLRARAGAALLRRPRAALRCQQSFRPDADALERDGLSVVAEADEGRWPLVLVLPPRQRQESRALLAAALDRLAPGGTLVAAAANAAGARSAEADLAQLAGPATSLSKHKCRVFWSRPAAGAADSALAADWRTLDAPRPVADGLLSRPGLFAWDRIDPASALLASQLPTGLAGRVADLGAGVGYLARELLRRGPGIAALDLYEAEARALELARTNLAAWTGRVALDLLWHDVARGLPRRYDLIVSNPPFHVRGADDPGLGRAFIAAAADALAPRGQLWLVANRHLPYEQTLAARFGELSCTVQRDGYKIFRAAAPRAPR